MRNLIFKPGNHQDLTMLFCLIQDKLNLIWIGSALGRKRRQRKSSPDGEVWDYSNGHGEIKSVEFELFSSQYDHAENFDYLVCWHKDKDIPGIKIIELENYFPTLEDKEQLRDKDDTQKIEYVKRLTRLNEWTREDFLKLTDNQQAILLYFLRKECPVKYEDINKDLGNIGDNRDIFGAISGFTQKQKYNYEEIIKKISDGTYKFVPEMRSKYKTLIEQICMDNPEVVKKLNLI